MFLGGACDWLLADSHIEPGRYCGSRTNESWPLRQACVFFWFQERWANANQRKKKRALVQSWAWLFARLPSFGCAKKVDFTGDPLHLFGEKSACDMSRQPFTPCPLCGTPQNWHRFSFGFLLKQAQAFLINYKTPTTKHPPPVSLFFGEAKKYVLPRSSDVSEVQRLLGSGQAVVLAWGDARNLEMEPWSQWENMEGVLGVGDV